MEDVIGKFRVASVDGKILGAAPRPENLVKATKLLAKLGKDYQYEVLINGLSIPVSPLWGKYNDPRQWWSLNDYGILCAAYQHETEIFPRTLSPYLPKGELEPDPTTPPRAPRLYPSVLGPPKKSRNVTFPVVPISSITSSVRLGVMLSEGPEKTDKERYPPHQGWKHLKKKNDDPFADSDSPKGEISTILRSKEPADPSSDGSDSDDSEGDKPPKIPPRSSKRPSAVPLKSKEEVSIKTYHFDMKLKPKTVPTWDGNKNTLARWIEKVEQLAATSPDIFKELGKIVPQRFTKSAEVWYYSILSKDREPLEQNWGTLKSAIADYWMNHSWLEEQKF